VREIEVAAAAGYDGIEIWLRSLEQYLEGGGSLADLRRRIDDLGIRVESAIGFARWIVDDVAERARALEGVKRDMERLAQLGCARIAAPPAGATKDPRLDLRRVAERYRALLETGDQFGVVPQVEVWGASKNLGRLAEAVYVAVECGHPNACLLPDVYHLYRGGSGFEGLGLLGGRAVQVFHINDYPADPPRERLTDADRVLPGQGVAPLGEVLRTLASHGREIALSLELFNRDLWKLDPGQVARTGLEAMKSQVRRAAAAAEDPAMKRRESHAA